MADSKRMLARASADSRTHRLRWSIWISALALTLYAMVAPKPQHSVSPAPAFGKIPSPVGERYASDPRLADRYTDIGDDPFAPKGWQPAPQPSKPAPVASPLPVVPLPPAPPPGPPPLPFRFAGQMEEGGHAVIYLNLGEQALTAQIGTTLDQRYKVLEADDKHVVFEYLPTGDKQTLWIDAKE